MLVETARPAVQVEWTGRTGRVVTMNARTRLTRGNGDGSVRLLPGTAGWDAARSGPSEPLGAFSEANFFLLTNKALSLRNNQ